MPDLTINFIGAGKLGKTIAKLIVNNNAGTILGICNTNITASRAAVDFIGQGKPYNSIQELPGADVTFITVPDDHIENICKIFSSSKNFNPSSIIIHCSGLLTSDVLKSARSKGASVISIHPMRSFADPNISVQTFSGTYCAIEGDSNAEPIGRKIFEKLGGIVRPVTKAKKAIYHASAVMSSNYVIALADTAIKCLRDAGLSEDDSMDIILNMMQGTLKNLLAARSTEKALTGPIKRGDIETIRAHVSAISDQNIKDIYKSLGKATLDITTHDHLKKKVISDALQEGAKDSNDFSFFIKAKL